MSQSSIITLRGENMTAQMKMNSLTLLFSGEVEKEFIKDYFQKSLVQVRLALVTAIFFYAAYGILDAVMIPEFKTKIWFIRYAIVCPSLLCILCYTFFSQFRKFMQASISLAILIVGFGIIAMPIVVPNAYFERIYVSLMLVLMTAYTFTKLRFVYATITGWTIVLAYEVVAIWISKYPLPQLVTINFGLISANLIGMFACYLIELHIRREYVQTQLLEAEREKSERLLLNILPQPIAEQLKQQKSTLADHFPEATVLFADIVDFTKLSARVEPTELVALLNQIFSAFDMLAERHGLEKIKTIGDSYMVVGGLPSPRIDHAEAVAEMALDMQQEIARFQTEDGERFNIRIGINTGPVVAGVIGIKKFIYDLWGDTVNTASRMESHGIPGYIHVTAATYDRLRDKYVFKERGTIQVKGKGEMLTYLLTGKKVHTESKMQEARS